VGGNHADEQQRGAGERAAGDLGVEMTDGWGW
jgi:hypothetical protein